tara:strand:- start:31330 stop:31452 length:123 start_codon:yes stop_codon:yes gene_type:complete
VAAALSLTLAAPKAASVWLFKPVLLPAGGLLHKAGKPPCQ